ncbi:MAG: hypothetical protein ACP5OA_05685 [Candidatus Woesearchaeota archaeon]
MKKVFNIFNAQPVVSDRRGQIEMFGLAFIIILITLGFFIYASLKSQEIKQNPQKEFTNDKMSNDFVLAILHVNVQGCSEYTIRELLIDCARDKLIYCNGQDSCMALNDSVSIMLNKTFMSRDMSFRFYSKNLEFTYTDWYGIPISTEELFNVSYKGCNQNSIQGKSGWAAITLHPAPGEVYLYMNLCYQ